MKLYTFYQSGAAYRIRIALNLKGIAPEMAFVNLARGEQHSEAYAAVNPQMAIPTLIDEGHHLRQSLAMMEYLEEAYPTPPILPKDAFARAHVRSLAMHIACDISPLGNLSVRKYITGKWGHSEEEAIEWIRHWIYKGFDSFERILGDSHYTGQFCYGDDPTMADCCLVPQMFNARRWKCDLAPYPRMLRITEACESHPAFMAAHPLKQPDAD